MRTPSSTRLAVIALAATIGACASDPNAGNNLATPGATVTIPPETRLLSAPVGEPQDLPGVDTSSLNARERSAFWRWASQLYAPCPEVAVSVAECVQKDRECALCLPAARFLAARAHLGSPSNEAIAAFTARFTQDVKKIDAGDSPVRGRADAPVTIVVWSDYQCPACGYAVPLLDEALEKHPNEVRLVHKLYPLKVHSFALPAAKAALAAKKQGKYWEMEHALFANQKALEDADLERYARELGLDMARFKRDIADPKADEVIERDKADADKHGLSGTPFIVINGREFDLTFFKLDRDLEPWISAEVELAKRGANGGAKPASSEVPAASAAPSVTPVATSTLAVATSATPIAPSAMPVATSTPAVATSATPVTTSTTPAATNTPKKK